MSDAKAKHVKHLLHLDSLEYVWCKHIMRARQFILKVHRVVRCLSKEQRSRISISVFFLFLDIVCCCHLVFVLSHPGKAIIRDYSFLPAFSPCFDPFLCSNTILHPSGQQSHIFELIEHSGRTDFSSTKLDARQRDISAVSYSQL